jgi:hypothetical protein
MLEAGQMQAPGYLVNLSGTGAYVETDAAERWGLPCGSVLAPQERPRSARPA